MKLLVNQLQPSLVYMRINLRGRNIRVPQEFLNDSQIGSVRQQVCCERVPQKVRIDVGIKSCDRRNFL